MESRGVAPGPKPPSTPLPKASQARSSPEKDLFKRLINALYIKMCSKCPMSQTNGGLCPGSDEDIIECLTDTIAENFKPDE